MTRWAWPRLRCQPAEPPGRGQGPRASCIRLTELLVSDASVFLFL